MTEFDSLVRNVAVVRHDWPEPRMTDVAIRAGKVAEVATNIAPSRAATVLDGDGRLLFPGAIDVHQHWGIYNSLGDDAASESRACLQGGVTSAINYMRTGQYYLNKGGPYRDFFPEVLAQCESRAHIDYAFHLAPMSKEHISEIPSLITDQGVTSFKIFMFYGGHGLHGRSADQSSFLMTPEGERYDIAHFEFVMRGIQAAREQFPELADDISLGLHCETAEIMTAYTELVEQERRLSGLEAYHESRPPHSEGLAVTIASYLAHETGLPKINLLHLSSAKAMDAAMRMATAFPHIDFRREVTIGHLLADITTAGMGVAGKVNPPLRPRADVESLWQHLLDGNVDWVVSDHACCRAEEKFGEERNDVFLARSGFGGAEYLLPGLVSEGRRRGLSYSTIAMLTAFNPAQRFGLHDKGVIAPGYDADLTLIDPDRVWTIQASDSESTQGYTPFEGMKMHAAVTDTFLRGVHVLMNGEVVGAPVGRYLRRPTGRA